jgi:hypothetical protein
MAQVAVVYTTTPFVRTAEDINHQATELKVRILVARPPSKEE